MTIRNEVNTKLKGFVIYLTSRDLRTEKHFIYIQLRILTNFIATQIT